MDSYKFSKNLFPEFKWPPSATSAADRGQIELNYRKISSNRANCQETIQRRIDEKQKQLARMEEELRFEEKFMSSRRKDLREAENAEIDEYLSEWTKNANIKEEENKIEKAEKLIDTLCRKDVPRLEREIEELERQKSKAKTFEELQNE